MAGSRLTLAFMVGALLALVAVAGASARTSREGGTLFVALGRGDTGTLDPTRPGTLSSLTVYRTFCEKLYDFDADLEVVPQLATALPVVSKDRLSYTVRLRKGVVFNDGTPFDADAVVKSILRHKTNPLSSRASDLEPLESITATGPYTVVFRLKAPFGTFVTNLATAAGTILSPAQVTKLGDNFASSPVCVGPFMYDSRVVGDSITVVRSPYYYDRSRVHLDRIVFKIVNGAPAAAALEAGDVQALDAVLPTELQGVARKSGLKIIGRKMFGYEGVYFNLGNRNGVRKLPYGAVDTVWARSAKLRQAFEEAIDRRTLIRVLYGGRAQTGCTAVSPASRWFDAAIECTPYDPADARKLVAASGVPEPTLHLLTSFRDPEELRLGQFIQAEEKAAGINVVLDDGSSVSDGDYEAALVNWSGSAGGDPDRNLFAHLATNGSRNYSGYSNPRLDLILENARRALQEQARRTLYDAAERIILADRPIVYLFHPVWDAAVDTTRVTGVDFSQTARSASRSLSSGRP